MILASVIGAGALSSAAAMPAGAATEVGSTFDPGTSSCGNLVLQSVFPPADTYAAPFEGVITSWSYQASEGPVQLKFKVGRPAGENDFTIVGESSVRTATAGALNTFRVRIPVADGDVIGIRPVTEGLPCIRAMTGYSYSAYVMGDDLPPGNTATFNPPVAGVQLDVSAALEADGDGDGFGNETQDHCLTIPGPDHGCPTNDFGFGKVKRNKQRGIAMLTVVLPGPGALALTGNGLVERQEHVGARRRVPLKVRAKGGKNRKLIRTGHVNVKARVTYKPTGGEPNTETKRVKLLKRL